MNTLLTTTKMGVEILINLDKVNYFKNFADGTTLVNIGDNDDVYIQEHFCNIVEILHERG